jgi:hypothetical protein
LTGAVWLPPGVIMSCAPEKPVNMSSSMDSKAFSTPKRFFAVSLGNVDKVFAST